MAKGKFEAGKGGVGPAGRTDPYAVKNKPAKPSASGRRLWPILAAVAGVAVLVVGILILTKNNRLPAPETTVPSTVELLGMPRAELEERFAQLNELLRRDITLTLEPVPDGEGRTEEPIQLTLTQAELDAKLDLTKLAADLDAGVGQEAGDSYLLDPRDYLVLNEEALRMTAETAAEEYGTAFEAATAELETPTEEDLAGLSEEDETPDKVLVVRTGVIGRDFNADQLIDAVKNALETALIAEDPETVLAPSITYALRFPEPVDPEALYERYCKEPTEPTLDPKTGEVSEGKDGYGFELETLTAALEEAEPGAELRLPMAVRKPELDAETLRESLFKDVLAKADTNHTSIANRTNNLKLACAAIDGTILLPGDVFSFNKVVGERTEAKGYKEAIAYVHGGESKPEVGGGVCQVASSIYYAVLQADLKTIEREPHMYLVDYVPSGMDTTIYWGYLDYKFENSSPYPIKIEASVSGGQVHIKLLGTEWKDYTVELSYEVLDTEPWKEVEKEVPNDGTYYKGEVITTPYTGYKIATYRTTRDRETGKKIETTQIAISRYSKRDKVIAVPTGERVNPTTPPTQPTQKPTTPPTQPTTPPTQPTTPPTQPTTPPTEPTTPPTEPTTPPTQPTTPPTQPTTPPTEPTTPPTEPTTPPTEPTTPPTEPTTPPTEPTTPPTEPAPPEPSEDGGE